MEATVPLKRTPIHAAHKRLGARLVEFGGWDMPVQYSSIVDEHLCVRRAAGIFDISHMGEVWVRGAGAEAFLNETLTNDVRKLATGQGQYSLMCLPTGGVVDDLYVYRVAPEAFLLVINASRIVADVAWLHRRHADFSASASVGLENVSDHFGAVALQGPRVVQFIGTLFPGPSHAGTLVASVTDLKKNEIGAWRFDGEEVWVARTGYTGEDGFEVVAPAGWIAAIWDRALAVGHVGCLQPCGLGARDTLRTEMGYPLYGHELDEQTTPLEAGLGYFVSFDKGNFIGRDALVAQKTHGTRRRAIAFRMDGKSAPPRPGYPIWVDGVSVGTVVSGTQSPSLGCGIGMGYVPTALAVPGTRIEVESRGKRYAAEIVKKPIYRRV